MRTSVASLSFPLWSPVALSGTPFTLTFGERAQPALHQNASPFRTINNLLLEKEYSIDFDGECEIRLLLSNVKGADHEAITEAPFVIIIKESSTRFDPMVLSNHQHAALIVSIEEDERFVYVEKPSPPPCVLMGVVHPSFLHLAVGSMFHAFCSIRCSRL